jgi:hypothetical protein
MPTLADPLEARAAMLRHRDAALEGLRWCEESALVLLVWLPALRNDGRKDIYLARFDFSWYPTWPPSVTFLDRRGREPSPLAWPNVSPPPTIAFYPTYDGAPNGMVCNSMFFEYYFWGGHAPGEAIRWNATRTFAASINELREALRPPYYQGKRT